jgi:hypothetical protein
MTLRVNFFRAVLHIAAAIMLIALFGALWARWQEGHWPQIDFYISFLAVLALFPPVACLIGVPKCITLTEDSLTIAWPLRRTVSVPIEELEYYMQAQVFMIQLEGYPTQLIYPGGFHPREWRAFVHELENRFPERKALWSAGTVLFGRRKP